VELEEAKAADGVGLRNDSTEMPWKASVSATADNRQMVV
jgi:hypothetical protein